MAERITPTMLRKRVERLQKQGFDIAIGWAYGQPRCTNKQESKELSPRLPCRQMMDWLGGFEEGAETQRGLKRLSQLEYTPGDHQQAGILADRLGYKQTAYTSTSDLIGLFCLPENPTTAKPRGAIRGGCIIKTAEFGLMFVQTEDDLSI